MHTHEVCASLLLVLVACEQPSSDVPHAAAVPATADSAAIVDRAGLDRLADGARTVDGRTSVADAVSTWQAALRDGRLVRVTESMQRGEYATSQLRHYFVNGLHRRTEERRIAVMLNPNTMATRDTIVIEITWDAAGRAVTTQKTINGIRGVVQSYEVDEVRAHVASLAQQALIRGGRP
jgi:hypothetical protein